MYSTYTNLPLVAAENPASCTIRYKRPSCMAELLVFARSSLPGNLLWNINKSFQMDLCVYG